MAKVGSATKIGSGVINVPQMRAASSSTPTNNYTRGDHHSSRPQKSFDIEKRGKFGFGLRGLTEEQEHSEVARSATKEPESRGELPNKALRSDREYAGIVNREASFLESTNGRQNTAAHTISPGGRPQMRRDKGSRRRLCQSKSKHRVDERTESDQTQDQN